MKIRKEDAYQYTLCIDVTPGQFRFSILNPKSKKSLHSESIALENFTKEALKVHVQSDYFDCEYENVVVSYGGERATLIPVDLFSHSSPKDVFKLNYPTPIDNLDYNRIPELGIVNIYEMPLWIKSVFVLKFPRSKFVHRTSVLLKGVFDQPTFAPKIHVHLDVNHFHLAITKKSRLDYFNRFEYKELADLVYYILFVLEQKEYDQSDFEILIYGVPSGWSDKKWFQSFFKAKLKIADSPELSEDFCLTKQLLCV